MVFPLALIKPFSKYGHIHGNMQSAKTKIESYPAPSQLTTQTDLSSQEIKAITVNPLIADAFALYIKTKTFIGTLWFTF